MLLSALISTNWISVVAFEKDPFKVTNRLFYRFPQTANSFFGNWGSKEIEDLICNKFDIKNDDYHALEKIVVFTAKHKEIEGWISYTIQHVLASLGDRVLFLDFDDAYDAFKNDPDLLNRYANFHAYNEELDSDIVKKIVRHRIRQHFEHSIDTKAQLQEFVVSFEDMDDSVEKTIRTIVVEEFGDLCDINHVFEFTYDYGCFVISTLAALVHMKANLVDFFKENPVHIDQKLVVIPEIEENIELYIDGALDELDHDYTKLLKFKIGEKNMMQVVSTDSKRKVNLELYGCHNGIYLDTRKKQYD